MLRPAAPHPERRLSQPIDNPVAVFAILMGVFLLVPLVAARLRVPAIVALILAGALLGENALAVLERDRAMVLLGTVGLLYIMFLAGLEIDLERFARYRNHSLVFGALTFFVPQVVGTVLAYALLGFGFAAAVLLASMFASHTLVSYPIASRLGITKDDAVTTTIGGTLITDTAALLVLAVVTKSHQGDLDAGFWVRLVVSLAIYVAAVLKGLPALGRWFFRNVPSEGGRDFCFVLGAVFAAAFLAEVAGVEPIIGAFLAGLSLNRLIPEHGPLMSRIHFMGEALFIPMFLVSVGMLVDARVLAGDARALTVAGFMVVAVIATKLVAADATRRLLGYTREQGLLIFGLSVNQAAATLAAVFVGYRIGLFDEAVLNGAVLMILASCLIGPWATERYGRLVAQAAEAATYDPGPAPPRILVPLSNPATAEALMDLALLLRDPRAHDPIFPLAVSREDAAAQVAAAERMLGRAVVHAAAAGVPVVPIVRVDENVAIGISRALLERRIATVILGWNGAVSAEQRIFGSVFDQLLHRSQQQVVVARFGHVALNTTERVLFAVPPYADREPGFEATARTVKGLAARVGARLEVLAVEATTTRLRGLLEQAPPTGLAARWLPLRAWGELEAALAGVVRGPDDILVLVSARQGRRSWSPGLDRLPRRLSEAFPAANLLVVYPPESEVVQAAPTSSEAELPFTSLLAPDRIVLDVAAEGPALLRALLEPLVRARPQVGAALVEEALASDRAAVEPTPGLAILHRHVQHVTSPTVFVGVSPAGLTLPGATQPVHVVVLLLSPEGEPEAHLRALATIAHTLGAPDVVPRLREATTLPEAWAVLSHEAAPAPAPVA